MSRRAGAVGQNTEALPFGNSLGRKRWRRRRCFVRLRPCAKSKCSPWPLPTEALRVGKTVCSEALHRENHRWQEALRFQASALNEALLGGEVESPAGEAPKGKRFGWEGAIGFTGPASDHWEQRRFPFFHLPRLKRSPFCPQSEALRLGKPQKGGAGPGDFSQSKRSPGGHWEQDKSPFARAEALRSLGF